MDLFITTNRFLINFIKYTKLKRNDVAENLIFFTFFVSSILINFEEFFAKILFDNGGGIDSVGGGGVIA